jgi:hypothetical protein
MTDQEIKDIVRTTCEKINIIISTMAQDLVDKNPHARLSDICKLIHSINGDVVITNFEYLEQLGFPIALSCKIFAEALEKTI